MAGSVMGGMPRCCFGSKRCPAETYPCQFKGWRSSHGSCSDPAAPPSLTPCRMAARATLARHPLQAAPLVPAPPLAPPARRLARPAAVPPLVLPAAPLLEPARRHLGPPLVSQAVAWRGWKTACKLLSCRVLAPPGGALHLPARRSSQRTVSLTHTLCSPSVWRLWCHQCACIWRQQRPGVWRLWRHDGQSLWRRLALALWPVW